MEDRDFVARDLARRLQGEVRTDDGYRALYSTAACIFRVRPLAVVAPANEADVRAVLDYAVRRRIPITARGGGTGVAGQTLGSGIVLDFSRHMNWILGIDAARRVARVQPGVVLAALEAALAPHGLFFAPNPSSAGACTVGGMVATNAAGSRTVKYGAVRQHVRALRYAAPNADAEGEVAALWPGMRDAAARHRPRALKNSSGYHVYDAAFDAARLLVGSEGTLALVTEIELGALPLPAERVVARLGFADLEGACAAVPLLREAGVSACEILDETVVDLLERHHPDAARLLPRGARVVLLVEIDSDVPRTVERLGRVGAATVEVAAPDEAARLWKVRKVVSPLLERLSGRRRSCRLIEDLAVMPDRMGDLVRGLGLLFARQDAPGVIFGHAGDGHLHVNVLLDPEDSSTPERMERLASGAADLAIRLGGTLSGEHGDGILRAPYLRRLFGDLYPWFERVKRAFDPDGILNPGVKVAPPPARFAQSLRASWRPRGADRDRFALADRCNGCGHCVTYCPVYLEAPQPEHTPRALACVQTERADPALVRRVIERCASCRRCPDECPAGFDAVAAGTSSSPPGAP